MFRIFRYMKAFRFLGTAIKSKKTEMLVSLQFLVITTIVLSLLLYIVEHEANPEMIGNGWESFVWAFAKYIGDPGKVADEPIVTLAGQVIAFIVGILGIAIFAVPIGLIGSGFTEAIEEQQKEEDIRERNILTILVNKNDDVLINKTQILKKEEIAAKLKDIAKEFLANPHNADNLPEKQVKQIDGIGSFAVSKGVISLTNDNSTTFATYILVQNELQKAVNELRDETALNYFGQKYEKLSPEEKNSIQEAIPINISEATSK